ncbi:MAG: ribokinase [Propionibacteriaceae bacterium]|jgi:ribokinase|nr:ribokinase [Propionibacteriaceae bacterium]
MSDVAVVASFMMDYISYVTRCPSPGETVVAKDFRITVGGKGFNQAVAAQRFGAAVTALGCLGSDTLGDQFLAQLKNEGIDIRGLVFTEKAITGVGLPVVDALGQNAIVIAPGANRHLTADQIERHAGLITEAEVLLLQLEIPIAAGVAAARLGKEAGSTVILNPAPAESIAEYTGLVDVLIPNEIEAAMLSDAPDPTAQAADLANTVGATTVIVTLGDQGALVLDRGRVRFYPAIPAIAIDTTGAGDCFCGVLAAGLALGESIDRAVHQAIAAAAIAVGRPGAAAAMPTAREVNEIINRTPVLA